MGPSRIMTPSRIVALGLLLVSLGFGVSTLRLPLWLYGTPGPGMTPLLASICLFPLSIMLLMESAEEEDRLQAMPFVAWLSLVGLVVLTPRLGFAPASAAFSFLWAVVFYKRSLASAVAIAILAPAAMYLVFVLGLRIPIPMWPE